MRSELKRIEKSKIIAVMRNIPDDKAIKVMESLMKAGIDAIEVAFGRYNTSDVIKTAKKEFGDNILIGAGTVLTQENVKMAAEAGAQFAFSPNFNEEVVKLTKQNDMISIPGCLSPTEIYNAYLAGADAIKVFPANAVGAKYIKDIKAPMPFLNIIATGGIDKSNIKEFLSVGSLAVGLGSSLLNNQLIEEGDYQQLSKHAREYSSLVDEYTKGVVD